MEAIPVVFNKPLLKMDSDIADTTFDQDIGHLTLENSLRFFFFILLFVYLGVRVFY